MMSLLLEANTHSGGDSWCGTLFYWKMTGRQPLYQVFHELSIGLAERLIPQELPQKFVLKARSQQLDSDVQGGNVLFDAAQCLLFRDIGSDHFKEPLRSSIGLAKRCLVVSQQLRVGEKRGAQGNELPIVLDGSQGNGLQVLADAARARHMCLKDLKERGQVFRYNGEQHLLFMLKVPVERALGKAGFPRDLLGGHPRQPFHLNKLRGCLQDLLSCLPRHLFYSLSLYVTNHSH